MIALLINLIFWSILLGMVYWIILQLPLPHPFPTIIRVLFLFFALLVVLSIFGVGGVSLPKLHLG